VNTTQTNTLSLGKYLLSPLIKQTEAGLFAASISVRSGRGSGTHDRIYRFLSPFASHDEALQFALAQGRSLFGNPHQFKDRTWPKKI
jgi:hypothetical protein